MQNAAECRVQLGALLQSAVECRVQYSVLSDRACHDLLYTALPQSKTPALATVILAQPSL